MNKIGERQAGLLGHIMRKQSSEHSVANGMTERKQTQVGKESNSCGLAGTEQTGMLKVTYDCRHWKNQDHLIL